MLILPKTFFNPKIHCYIRNFRRCELGVHSLKFLTCSEIEIDADVMALVEVIDGGWIDD